MSLIKKNSLTALFVFFAMLFVVSPIISFAQGSGSLPAPCNPAEQICNPLARSGITDIGGFIHKLITGVLRIGIPVVALAIIYSGFLFVAARGNSEKLKGAKDALLYSIIGAAILLGAWSIAELLTNTVLAL